MIRIILASLIVMVALAGYLFLGFFQPQAVYAFSPVTQSGDAPFDLVLDGIAIRIESDDSASACLPLHSISVNGGPPYEILSDALAGPLVSASICDLDGDGDLELALVSRTCGSGAYLEVLLLEHDVDKWAERNRGPLPDAVAVGYMGHGAITISASSLLHRYPLYAEGDSNVRASGGKRLVEYRLQSDTLVEVASIESRSK